MSKFILKSTSENDIMFSGEIIQINIKNYIETDNYNYEVAHLLVETKEKNFLFRVCKSQEQGNNLNLMIDNIRKHFEDRRANNKDYIIDLYEDRKYIYISNENENENEYYYERYEGELLK